jgi:hypothetical protein
MIRFTSFLGLLTPDILIVSGKGSARKEQLYLGELRASDRDLIWPFDFVEITKRRSI